MVPFGKLEAVPESPVPADAGTTVTANGPSRRFSQVTTSEDHQVVRLRKHPVESSRQLTRDIRWCTGEQKSGRSAPARDAHDYTAAGTSLVTTDPAPISVPVPTLKF